MLSPTPGSPRATQDAEVVVRFSAVGETFLAASIDVDGVRAYTYGGSPVFSYPNASGSARLSSGSQVVTVKLRRRFVPGSIVPVVVKATTDVTPETTGTFQFSVDEPAPSVRDASLGRTRVDAPFPRRVLELYRQAAVGAVGSRGGSSLALLVHRVKPTQLACLLPASTNLAREVEFRPSELEPISRLADAAEQLDFMRPLAEEELGLLGVAPEVVATVSRGFASSYPQERAGAFALIVLLAADKL
jgi:hypothetical protein